MLNPKIQIGNIKWIYSVSWLFGFVMSIVVSLSCPPRSRLARSADPLPPLQIYTGLSWIFPDTTGSLIDQTVLAEDFLAEKGVHSSPSGEDLDEKLDGSDAYTLPASRV